MTIVALVVMCVFNIIITPLRLSASSDAVFDSLTLYQNVIDTVYIIYLLIISVVALVRGRDWWASKDSAVIIKQLKKKVWPLSYLPPFWAFCIHMGFMLLGQVVHCDACISRVLCDHCRRSGGH